MNNYSESLVNWVNDHWDIHINNGRSGTPNRYLQELNLLLNQENIKFNNISAGSVLWMIKNNIVDIPTCKFCGIELQFTKSGPRKYCSMNCYKSDPDSGDAISKIKTELYSDPKWKQITESKKIQTNLKNLGVEHPMQNPESFDKQKKSSFAYITVDGIDMQGYEPIAYQYLNMLGYSIRQGTEYIRSNDIKIFWVDDLNKKHRSYPDFYIIDSDGIDSGFVEVKSEYTRKLSEEKIRKTGISCSKLGEAYYVLVVYPNKAFKLETIHMVK